MVLEDIENEFDHEESRISRLIKRIFIIGTALFLIIILLIYLVPGNNLLDIIEGRFVSYQLDQDFAVRLKNGGKVIFDAEVYEELKAIYLEEQKNEFKVCLIGSKSGNNYYISSLQKPKIFSQDVFSVSAEQCGKEALIPLHSHPNKRCIFSSQDIKSYEAFEKINPEGIIGLMCETGRFSFYGY